MTMNEYKEKIQECCKKLRISGSMADRAMDVDADSHQEYLYKVLWGEVEIRDEKRLLDKLNAAGFPSRFKMEEFDQSQVVFEDGSVDMPYLSDLVFFRNKENVIMYGRSGTGKTMLSIILGIRLVYAGAHVRFFRTSDLLREFSNRKVKGSLDSFLDSLRKVDVLILDEFGYVPLEDVEGAIMLFDLVSGINSRTSIILNTNLEFSRWNTMFPDKRMTETFLNRMTGNSCIVLFQGSPHHLQSRRASPSEDGPEHTAGAVLY